MIEEPTWSNFPKIQSPYSCPTSSRSPSSNFPSGFRFPDLSHHQNRFRCLSLSAANKEVSGVCYGNAHLVEQIGELLADPTDSPKDSETPASSDKDGKNLAVEG